MKIICKVIADMCTAFISNVRDFIREKTFPHVGIMAPKLTDSKTNIIWSDDVMGSAIKAKPYRSPKRGNNSKLPLGRLA